MTNKERLRANKQIIVSKDQSGNSEDLYSLTINSERMVCRRSKNNRREPNTVKSIVLNKVLDILEQDFSLQFQPTDFKTIGN